MPTAFKLAVLVSLLVAQEADGRQAMDEPPSRTAAEHFGVLSANAVVGGITGALKAFMSGSDVSRAIVRGLAGGSVVYAGKAVTAMDWSGSILVGRTIASVGSDATSTAAASGPLFQIVEMPVGPLRFRVFGSREGSSRVRINLASAIALARVAGMSGMQFDWERSLAAATPVFVTQNSRLLKKGDPINGIATWGAVVLQERAAQEMDATFRHEMIHVIQYDFVERAWDQPLELRVREAHSWSMAIPTWIQAGVAGPAFLSILDWLWNDDQGVHGLMQAEAEWFERR